MGEGGRDDEHKSPTNIASDGKKNVGREYGEIL
jgi:hypothetical protein